MTTVPDANESEPDEALHSRAQPSAGLGRASRPWLSARSPRSTMNLSLGPFLRTFWPWGDVVRRSLLVRRSASVKMSGWFVPWSASKWRELVKPNEPGRLTSEPTP